MYSLKVTKFSTAGTKFPKIYIYWEAFTVDSIKHNCPTHFADMQPHIIILSGNLTVSKPQVYFWNLEYFSSISLRHCYEKGNGVLKVINKSSKNKKNGLVYTING